MKDDISPSAFYPSSLILHPFMSDRLAQLRAAFEQELAAVKAEADVTGLRDRWVGRKSGLLTAEMKTLGKLAPEERKTVGAQLNELKDQIEAAIEKSQSDFAAEREAEQLVKERLDVTLPGRRIAAGHLHPLTLLRERIEDIFV